MLFDAFGMGAQSFADHTTGAPLQRISYIARLFLTGFGSSIFGVKGQDRFYAILSALASSNLLDTTLTWGTSISNVHRFSNHDAESKARQDF
jgi:hypothetical protein